MMFSIRNAVLGIQNSEELLWECASSASADELHIATASEKLQLVSVESSAAASLNPASTGAFLWTATLCSALFSGSFTNSYRAVTMILIAPTWTGKNVRLLVNRRLDVKEGVGRVAGTDGLVRRHRMSTTALNCERLLTAVVSLGASHHRPSPAHTPGPPLSSTTALRVDNCAIPWVYGKCLLIFATRGTFWVRRLLVSLSFRT